MLAAVYSAQTLFDNRCHWTVESQHYMVGWNLDENRGRNRTGHGPKNVSRLRRKKTQLSIRSYMDRLMMKTRIALDYLKLTGNAREGEKTCQRSAGASVNLHCRVVRNV